MTKFGLWLGLWVASAACSQAQVTVEVTSDQDQFLPGEAISVGARITNRSGQPLHLGNEGWLTFSVESREGFVVLRTGEVPVAGEFTLESSERATKHVDLQPYFSLSKPGRYLITATVQIKQWDNQVITSAPKPFDLIQVTKLLEQDFGVPPRAGASNSIPEVRHYALQEAHYLRQLMLYFQLTGNSGKVYKVYPIGPILSFGQPDHQVDRLSNLHVLYQNGPHSFSYIVINPDGEIIIRRSYDFTTRPRLKADEDGTLTIVGGSRRASSDDLPPPAVDHQ